MGSQARRQRQRDEIRGRILEAARELFVAEGYDAVTMRRIAEKIEYTPPAIYFHFVDKAALIRELCTQDFLALAGQLERLAAVADPIARLAAIARAYVGFAEAHPNHYRLMFMTPRPPLPLGEEDRARQGNPDEDAYGFLKLTVEEAIARKKLRPELTDADLVAQALWGAVHGQVALQIAKCDDEWVSWRPLAARVDALVECLLRGMKRRAKAR